MMKYVMTVIRDSAAVVYGVPMFMASKGQAIRSFSDEVQRVDPANMLNKHPSDFELFYVGLYDDATCSFDCLDLPLSLIRGSDCVKE